MKVRNTSIAILDYGVGNHTSVLRTLRTMGYRAKVSRDKEELDKADIIVLPGVGAFPIAMHYLYRYELVSYLKDAHKSSKPIIGICLGMQLLAECSNEIKLTSGLGLIPGTIKPIIGKKWHIGWNSIEANENDNIFKLSDGESMFFNHSYFYEGPKEYISAISRLDHKNSLIASAIRKGKTIGLQFHPEKSQKAGLELLSRIINEIII